MSTEFEKGEAVAQPGGLATRASAFTMIALAAVTLMAGCGATLDGQIAASNGQALNPAALNGEPGVSESTTARPNVAPHVSRSADSLTSSATPGSAAYKIGPQDVLEFSVFKVPELSRTVQVADSGTTNLPLVGEIPVVGKTSQEIERDLTQRLGAKYLQQPQVSVYVKEYNSQRVTIDGAVIRPGVYPIRGKTSLLQIVATAGGFTPTSDSTVVVFRYSDGRRSAAKFDVDDIRSGSAEDPQLQQGDMIVAGTSAAKETLNNVLKVLPLAGVFAFL